ncbi:STM3941 family protein [Steroidobacter cummioxidans]|uniref:STM3941 family protein n=1 Tax=Steroidobacter cummioxidans TaxID=1803913 RepID=UPI000E310024|nr:STM3941 family protein [Steroidobacter cummioxidans]
MTTPILVVRSSRLKYILLLIASAGFVAGGVFLVVFENGARDWVGWMSIVFFGAGIPLFARQLFDSKPRVVLDEAGVFDRTLGVGTIPWSDIESCYVKSIHGNNFVCLVLRHPERWVSKLSGTQQTLVKVNEKLGFQPLNINLSGTAVDAALVQDVVLKKSGEYAQNG